VSQAWSWALLAVGVAGLWTAGSGKRAGWAVCLASQGLWLAYGLAARQWGFVASAFVYGFVYLRNWRKGR
jgi:hypothetical protein